jgi:spore germination protein GerM
MSIPPRSPRRRTATIVAAILLVLGLVSFVFACGVGDDVGDGGAVSTAGSQSTVTEPTESTEPAGSTTTTKSGGTDGTGTTSTSTTARPGQTTTTGAGSDTIAVKVYFTRDEKIATAGRVIPRTQSVGAAAMRSLLEGPAEAESAAGMVTAIPEGTTFLGLDIQNGVATVDLSREYASGGGSLSMMMRLAQVVFTLTQFPTVQGVNFMLDGEPIDVLGGEGIILDHPMTRADFEDLSPAILVESPILGATVSSPVRITGTANTFEATFMINIVDNDGLIIADEFATATSGTGTRGTFDVTVQYPSGHAGNGALIVFESSAKDGSPINVVEIPIVLK